MPVGYSRGTDCWRELPRKWVGGVFLPSLLSSRSRSLVLGAHHTRSVSGHADTSRRCSEKEWLQVVTRNRPGKGCPTSRRTSRFANCPSIYSRCCLDALRAAPSSENPLCAHPVPTRPSEPRLPPDGRGPGPLPPGQGVSCCSGERKTSIPPAPQAWSLAWVPQDPARDSCLCRT